MQSRSQMIEGGTADVWPICLERQKSSGSLQEYSGPALVSGSSGSSGGQQLWSRPPHAASSAAQRPSY